MYAGTRILGLFTAAATLVCGVLAAAAAPAQAESGAVVVSELMYHAPDDDTAYAELEFIELTNAGAGAQDVGGWTFSAGIAVDSPGSALAAGTVVPAGGRLVGSNDPGLFEAKFGFAPDFSFANSSLSNGGETVTLLNSAGDVADSVPYDDAAPWVTSPDGGGPSLELSDPTADNALASSWHASSEAFGTPGQVNTPAPLRLEQVRAQNADPVAGEPVVLRAEAPTAATLSLTYKVMFGADVVVPMRDDAASVGGAGDGVFSAVIPGAGEGSLIRFKVAANMGTSSATFPAVGDSRPYAGLVVQDRELDAARWPVLQWFMSDSTYSDMITNHRCDDLRAAATLVYDGVVLDGAMMKIKGHSTCSDAKAKWDVELPDGYTFDFGSPFSYPVKKFDMQNENIPVPRLGWEMIAGSGEVAPAYQSMRVQRNGAFFGNFGILENYDGTWRKNHGYGDSEFFKVEDGGLRTYSTAAALAASLDIDKKNPDDGDLTSLWQLTQQLAKPDSPAKRSWLRANVDLPQLANYTALTVVMRHWDSGAKNFYVVRDPLTRRWQILSWDLDDILNNAADPKGDFVFPNTARNKLYNSLYAIPEFRMMHFRRLRELYDQFYTGDTLINRFDALTTPFASDIAKDTAAWGGRSLTSRRARLALGIQERRNQIAKHTVPGEVPVSQGANVPAVISEIQYAPQPEGSEYLEVYNPSATVSVDLSGWSVPALGDFVVRPGTVLPPHSYLVWVQDDARFTATYGAVDLMAGQYTGSLDDDGEQVGLVDDGRTVDTVTYGAASPWPTTTRGTGRSLELVDLASDNTQPSNWAGSVQPALLGTPGAVNSVGSSGGPSTTTVLPFGASWSFYAPSLAPPQTWIQPSYDESSWSSGLSSLGFRSIENTTIPSQTNRFAYHFRTHFTVPAGLPVSSAVLHLHRDDGAVVYVNGVEVGRTNMPQGPVGPTTRASTNIGVGAAVLDTVSMPIPVGALVQGDNTLAVEVHQFYAASKADLYLDAELTITR